MTYQTYLTLNNSKIAIQEKALLIIDTLDYLICLNPKFELIQSQLKITMIKKGLILGKDIAFEEELVKEILQMKNNTQNIIIAHNFADIEL